MRFRKWKIDLDWQRQSTLESFPLKLKMMTGFRNFQPFNFLAAAGQLLLCVSGIKVFVWCWQLKYELLHCEFYGFEYRKKQKLRLATEAEAFIAWYFDCRWLAEHKPDEVIFIVLSNDCQLRHSSSFCLCTWNSSARRYSQKFNCESNSDRNCDCDSAFLKLGHQTIQLFNLSRSQSLSTCAVPARSIHGTMKHSKDET